MREERERGVEGKKGVKENGNQESIKMRCNIKIVLNNRHTSHTNVCAAMWEEQCLKKTLHEPQSSRTKK